jgi:hypothetical protein
MTSSTRRATWAPKLKTSWLIAESFGRTSSQSWESSQASSERSRGTETPISAATASPSTAMMSLS